MTQAAAWICPGCQASLTTKYCSTCGERPLRPRELTLRGLLDQIFAAFTSVDSKLLRTFRYLIARPGQLTVAFMQGRRQPFLGPVPLFLLANVLFFAAESLTGGKIFTTPLDSHLHTQPWSEFASGLVLNRVAALHSTLELYAPVFDRAVALKARSLIIFMALFFALMPMIAFVGSKRPLAVHAVFSLHLYATLLLLFSVATAIPPFDSMMGGSGFASETLDKILSISLVILIAAYLYIAIGAVYGARGVGRVLKTAVLTTGVAAIVLGYRFVLLLVTLYTA
jgi:hypothetical protein